MSTVQILNSYSLNYKILAFTCFRNISPDRSCYYHWCTSIISCFLQPERSPGPVVSRTRSWDSSSPVDRAEPEATSPTTRTRPVTRSMGTGDTAGLEVPSSPLRRAKRARLCSSSSSVRPARRSHGARAACRALPVRQGEAGTSPSLVLCYKT